MSTSELHAAIGEFERNPAKPGSPFAGLGDGPTTRHNAGVQRDDGGWPEPEPLGNDLLPVPPFEPEMLPEAFRDHAADISERMQVPADLPAVCAVTCLAGVVNRRAIIQPKRADASWTVVPTDLPRRGEQGFTGKSFLARQLASY
jgi:hypothetical protein